MSIFEEQRAFMEACGLLLPDEPGLNVETRLHRKLIHEERVELDIALDNFAAMPTANNLAKVAQEAVDEIYVLCGLLNNLGVDGEAVWNEIQRANLRKVDPETGRVGRRADGKILKPDGWIPPNILSIITGRGGV